MAWCLLTRRGTALKNNVARFAIFNKKIDYKKCYKILEIEESSDQEQIRAAYLTMVKRYHPDSGTEEANAEKFQEVDKAFKILIKKKSQERWDVEEAKKGLISSYFSPKCNSAYSSPTQAVPELRGHRVRQSLSETEAVHQGASHESGGERVRARVSKAQADEHSVLNKNRIYETWEKVPLKHKIKTKHGFDRLVEDLIQESMSKGEFNNLKGCGKPLPSYQNKNPYVDFVTHKINEVLIDNGFAPEWITLQKEIRKEANQLRDDLVMERQYFGPYPLSVEENIDWSERVYQYTKVVDAINRKITKFNLVVPVLNKQMLHISLQNEAQKAMVNGKSCEDFSFGDVRRKDKYKQEDNSADSSVNLFGIIDYLFKGK
ncbi:hypothetical protein NQ318_022294 [Aromia moschata]|uniref:J domain-containing protein n=1 Tax=Aromia moschata TaxID=1265417 RepID=A0AAV8Z4G4_9CUCU|nr:hypothetical protein NQ318_022294 [Aromia moschata]